MKRITATEASRNFSRLLDASRHRGETVVIERNGEPVAELRPAAPAPTVADALTFLRRAEPDEGFVDDIEGVLAQRASMLPVDRVVDGA